MHGFLKKEEVNITSFFDVYSDLSIFKCSENFVLWSPYTILSALS